MARDTLKEKHGALNATDLRRLRRQQFINNRFTKDTPRSPKSGIQKRGIPKKTMEFVDRMDELGCQPEEFLARVIIGQEPPAANPFLEILALWCEKHRGKQLTSARVESLLTRARKYLQYEPCPIDIRVNAARDLMQYKYPKRKAVEHTGNINVGTGVMRIPEPMAEEKWVAQATKEAHRILEHETDE